MGSTPPKHVVRVEAAKHVMTPQCIGRAQKEIHVLHMNTRNPAPKRAELGSWVSVLMVLVAIMQQLFAVRVVAAKPSMTRIQPQTANLRWP
jgi:hypothetical protein